MKIIHGRNLLIYADGVAVAAARSCRITMDFDTIEMAGVDSGTYKYYVTAMSSWSIQVDKLVSNVRSIFEDVGTMVSLSFVVRDEYGNLMGDRMQGEGFMKSANISATVGSLTTGNITFQGSGELVRQMDALRDYDQKDLYDYNHQAQLMAPSSNL
jgi:predicted secreted protein